MKLTPTTNDALHGKAPFKRGPGRPRKNGNGLHVVEAHEPLSEEAFSPSVTEPSGLWVPVPQPIPFVEQTVNIPAPAPIAEVQPLKVALIGTAPSSRMLAPFNDLSWKIWGCSPGNQNVLPRVDAWFEIHGNMLWPENRHYGEPYLEWLKQQKFPIYMQDRSFVPNAIPLPMKELVAEFGPYFFTSSFAWMMAMAIKAGAKEIALFGIDMASRDEYILQRPGAYHFFNEAARRGVKVSAPYESDIMMPPALYGFSDVTPFGRKILARKKELLDRLGGMRGQRDSLVQQITYLEGALEDLDYVHSIWGGTQNNSGLLGLG